LKVFPTLFFLFSDRYAFKQFGIFLGAFGRNLLSNSYGEIPRNRSELLIKWSKQQQNYWSKPVALLLNQSKLLFFLKSGFPLSGSSSIIVGCVIKGNNLVYEKKRVLS